MAIAFPYIAATAGWILTEMGRQPWIVQDLLKTADARLAERQHGHDRDEPRACSRCSTSTLGVVDFVLMRRYARVDPPQRAARAAASRARGPAPAIGAC